MCLNGSSTAVFGSYLRPDLVPANPSFFEDSSMGTISTSSIFVNVDNQTEERYGTLSALKPGASGHRVRVRHTFIFRMVKMLCEHMESFFLAAVP